MLVRPSCLTFCSSAAPQSYTMADSRDPASDQMKQWKEQRAPQVSSVPQSLTRTWEAASNGAGSPWVACAGAAPLAALGWLLSVPRTVPFCGEGNGAAGLVTSSRGRVDGSEFGICASWDIGHSLRETWSRLGKEAESCEPGSWSPLLLYVCEILDLHALLLGKYPSLCLQHHSWRHAEHTTFTD